IAGSIHEVGAPTTGSRVKKNEVLASFVAPEALPAIQLFILNSGAMDRTKLGPSQGHTAAELAAANLRQRLDQLENIGMSMDQLNEIAETELFPSSIRIVSPADGVILSRGITQGMKFEKGMEFYRIADLRKVWIQADVFEHEAESVKPGQRVQFSLPGQSRTYSAVVSSVLPQFDPTSRTMKLRLEADNSDGMLLPGMFVDLKISIPYPPSIVVPADAVLDSGLQTSVFVENGNGMFAPRAVETGWRFDNQVEIVKGLMPGDRVVTSGTFLLESETRMKHGPAPLPAAKAPAAAPSSAAPAKAEMPAEMPQDHSQHHHE
ncbi:MAG: hypothetical protein RL328_2715, partial [Acidobacteriota bacterium]